MLVTDESGDDGTYVEEARQALKKYQVPLYVIGRQSLFGYPYAHHQYVDPVTKDVYHPLIRRGPETADLELYQWDGLYDRWDEQPSGFAPYELARLTRDSGGIYFVLPSEEFMRIRQREQAYSITQLKEYLPEYNNRLAYVERRNSSALRKLLHDIVLEGKAFIYQRVFPIEPADMVKAALEEGEKATIKLNELLAIQTRLEQASEGSRARSREAMAGTLRPDAGSDRRVPGQGLRVSRADGVDRQDPTTAKAPAHSRQPGDLGRQSFHATPCSSQ